MIGKIIQIATMPESERTHAAIWALTDTGELYFLLLREGKWAKQDLPSGKIPVQKESS